MLADMRFSQNLIHANPLVMMTRRERENPEKALLFLESYRWSSYPDYIGEKNVPSVSSRQFLWDSLGGPVFHRKEMQRWVTAPQPEKISDVAFDAG